MKYRMKRDIDLSELESYGFILTEIWGIEAYIKWHGHIGYLIRKDGSIHKYKDCVWYKEEMKFLKPDMDKLGINNLVEKVCGKDGV